MVFLCISDTYIQCSPSVNGDVKRQFYFQSRIHLIKADERVGASEATLLNMLGISPFTYGLQILQGQVLSLDVPPTDSLEYVTPLLSSWLPRPQHTH